MSPTDQETRLALLEHGFGEVKDDLKELAGEVRKLVGVMSQQAEDRASLSRAFGRLDAMDAKITAITTQLSEMERARLQRENTALLKAQEESIAQRRRAIGEILKLADHLCLIF